jgi:hypothetical protein
MLDPFTIYTRLVSAGTDMLHTARRGSETADAAALVIARRMAMIGEAARAPLDGDYAELGRMVPEKVEAFSSAGAAMAGACWDMQSAYLAEVQHWRALAGRARAPTVAEWWAHGARNAAFGLRMFELAGEVGAKGLRPIHAAATANAKRLKQTKARPGA